MEKIGSLQEVTTEQYAELEGAGQMRMLKGPKKLEVEVVIKQTWKDNPYLSISLTGDKEFSAPGRDYIYCHLIVLT